MRETGSKGGTVVLVSVVLALDAVQVVREIREAAAAVKAVKGLSADFYAQAEADAARFQATGRGGEI